jgi:DNA polymerase III sliding clamp (beta) subunit (PCNA family)
MLTLNVETYRKFIQASSFIPPNAIRPNVNYILLQHRSGKLIFTKTNLHTFCRMEVDGGEPIALNEDFLLEEKAVTSFINLYARDTVQIETKNEEVVISSGKNKIGYSLVVDHDVPPFPTPQTEAWYYLDSDNMDAIRSASQCIKVHGNPTMLHFVHLGPNGIFGSNGSYVYHKKNDDSLPEAVFNAKTCEVLDNFIDVPGIDFNINPSFNFFKRDNLSYAVIGVEFKTFDYLKFIHVESTPIVEISKDDLQKFCTTVINASDSDLAIASIHLGDDDNVVGLFQDNAYKKGVEVVFPGENLLNEDWSFRFLAVEMQKYLRALPYDKIRLEMAGKNYKITTSEDEKFLGIIQAVQ